MIVTFQPHGKKQKAFIGDNLLEVAQNASILINANCAGNGSCGKCKVKILAGNVNQPDEIEKKHLSDNEILSGWRLACRVKTFDNITVYLPKTNEHIDNRSKIISLPKGFIPEQLQPKEGRKSYGIAFDIGTTTVVGMLWDLKNATLIDTIDCSNPQSIYGSDVITRIQFSIQKKEHSQHMQKIILNCLNNMIEQLINKSMLSKCDIQRITIVANTTMVNFLLNINPTKTKPHFGLNPYHPITLNAKELGLLMESEATVYILPGIAGYVGSDTTAVLLATDLKDLEGANLAIDVGTNGEVLLAHKNKVITCSTAAGPAFEGASISQGMRATKGAIEAVKIRNSAVELSIINDDIPVGICGSGLIDCISEMLSVKILLKDGRLLNRNEALQANIPIDIVKRLRESPKGNEFVLYYGKDNRDIAITQNDIREVQLAKGAILAGVKILMKELEVKEKDLNNVFLAGAFGNYINKKNALKISLSPIVPEEKINNIGNAAGVGACMALLSKTAREHSHYLAKKTKHIELANYLDFQEIFLESMYF